MNRSDSVTGGGNTVPSAMEPEPRESSGEASSSVLLPHDSIEQPEISFVLPTLNEEEGIGTCIGRIVDALERLSVTGEIIVSDSSNDRTASIARLYGAYVVEPDKPGYGYAYRYALQYARGKYVAIGDADTTYDFRELPALYERVRQDGVDMVLGSRLDGEIEDDAMPPLHRYVGNPLLTKFLNSFYGLDVSDAHSGFRIIDHDALDDLELTTDGMEFASEMLMAAGKERLRIEEHPITYQERTGEATLDTFRDGWRHIKFMLVNAPMYVFLVPAIVLVVIGLLMMGVGSMGAPIFETVEALAALFVGGWLVVVGYQTGTLAVFSTVASDPIQKPTDHLTRLISENFRMEHGISVGLSQVFLGVTATGYIIAGAGRTIDADVALVPALLIVLGVQTVFSSLFMSAVTEYPTGANLPLAGPEETSESSR